MRPGFQIVVPTFNEEETLEQVLQYAKDRGYLRHLVFVDDASTDSSLDILRKWRRQEGLRVISLRVNRKKEGAIRAALEVLEQEGTLAEYTIILDSDSVIADSEGAGGLDARIENAIQRMRANGTVALAFRIEAISSCRGELLALGAFADYSAMQFDQWLVGKQRQLWVINGPGGLFETAHLLEILRSIVPDFETGDLLITVQLMKRGLPIEFFPEIAVQTYVPTTLRGYFNQRRRWERGTTKVLWNERKFYLRLFRNPTLLGCLLIIHLSLYVGATSSLVMVSLDTIGAIDIAAIAFTSVAVWYGISVGKGLWLRWRRPEFPLIRYCACAGLNGLIWALVTTPARVVGFCEAVMHCVVTGSRGGNLRLAEATLAEHGQEGFGDSEQWSSWGVRRGGIRGREIAASHESVDLAQMRACAANDRCAE